ncbi:putative DAD family protein [Rosellinia necatrix]|uniref:Dolichyl-diphosphooligosaccharide--protein glycosyltransferase subunit OST2 n=1 Tax=Rosellinia necatrix TaxID=77044 RepID=A0A1S7UJU8_ROSNE|nr:putative DAD family protein [Rosellinia necatrix]
MAPKKPATATGQATTSATPTSISTSGGGAIGGGSSTNSASSSRRLDNIARNIVQHYQKTTPQRTKLIDVFMTFLVIVGGLQFAYCVLAGNYPFNAFLSGFSATVGQFVLTASLRIQTTEANKSEFPSVSPERAFADYVIGSLILHFFCINFIN